MRRPSPASAGPALAALAALLAASAQAQPSRPAAAKTSAGASPVLFSTDLEGEDQACWSSRPRAGCLGWTGIRDACFGLCVAERSHSGSKALRIAFAKNEDYGGAFRGAGGRHVFTRFYDYYESGFDFAAGMKIHRLSAFNQAAQKNDYDIILQLKADEPGGNNCGLTEAKWMALSFNGGPVDWGSAEARFSPVRGRWYLIETEILLNAPGKADGELRVRVDGKLLIEKKGVPITGGLDSPINSVLFGGWYSNAAGGRNPCPDPVGPSIRYVDDPAVSLSYIGPVPDAVPGGKPGSREIAVTLPWPGTLRAEFGATEAYGSLSAEAASTTGRYVLSLEGLDTNRTYHYRLLGALQGAPAGSEAYQSPDLVLSTGPAKLRPAGPPKPINLPSKRYDPIPD